MSCDKPDDVFLNRNLYSHVPHYRSEIPHSAIISGQTKVMHFYEKPDIPMMFNLSSDPGEVTNVAKNHPDTHKKLFGEMMGYFEEIGARLPKINLNYDPEVYRNLKEYDKFMQWGPFENMRLRIQMNRHCCWFIVLLIATHSTPRNSRVGDRGIFFQSP